MDALDREVRPGVPYPEILVELRERAKSDGLWNLFLPDERFGPGLTNWEYGMLCELMGRNVAGTEIGVKEPQPTFSACFGAPFLPQPPVVYARLLAKRLDEHGARVWLVNTGWTGGMYGEGSRMPIKATRALLRAAIAGELAGVEYRTDPLFGFEVPVSVPGVESSLLQPRLTWADPEAYDAKARELADMFRENFSKFTADDNIVAGGPS